MRKINFFLPGFYENFRLMLYLDDLMKEKPEFFVPNSCIRSVYGCFPGSIWNGGRVILGNASKQEMEQAITEYNKRGIAVRYTFTNPLLEKVHLFDTYCNLCMEMGDNGQNEVIVNSPVLEEFIRKMYPNYSLISSTTKCLQDRAKIEEELQKDYTYVVLDSALNNTKELFEFSHREKIELIANHFCMDNCPKRQEHYKAIGRCQLEYAKPDFPRCENINRDFCDIQGNRSFISAKALYGEYYEAGFYNFKLDGRSFKKHKLVESLVYYLAKEEYRDKVRSLLLKIIMQ